MDVPDNSGYLTRNRENVYYTLSQRVGSKYIVCCDENGKEKWRSKLGNSGIASAKDGTYFLIDSETNMLSIVSSDGTRHRCLLSARDTLSNPMGIDFQQESTKLLIIKNSLKCAAVY